MIYLTKGVIILEIKVNDYVRTKKGIAKIIDRINDPTNYYDKFWVCDRYLELNDDTEYICEQDIIGEPKEKIIDLICVGDYVNGKKVVGKQYHYTDEDNYDMGEWCIVYENVALGDYQYDIETVLTKEVFEQMEYKID